MASTSVPPTLFPFTPADIERFTAGCAADALAPGTLKLDWLGNGVWWASLSGMRADTGRRFVWPGFLVEPTGVALPPYLAELAPAWSERLTAIVSVMTSHAFAQPEMKGSASLTVTANGHATPQGVGGDRITPGDTHPVIYIHHAKRYVFATGLAAGRDVLDLGCGVGYGSRMLSKVARGVVSLDVSGEAVAYAREIYGAPSITFFASDARALALGPGCVDLVVWFEMLEHIQEQAVVVAEVARVLRPGGRVVVSTPNKRVYEDQPDPEHYHCGLLELDEFEALFRAAFEEVELWSQPRQAGKRDVLQEFDVKPGADPDAEIFIAVATGPKVALRR